MTGAAFALRERLEKRCMTLGMVIARATR